jgi:hypothetical protein
MASWRELNFVPRARGARISIGWLGIGGNEDESKGLEHEQRKYPRFGR